jgi:hypothetical protein
LRNSSSDGSRATETQRHRENQLGSESLSLCGLFSAEVAG